MRIALALPVVFCFALGFSRPCVWRKKLGAIIKAPTAKRKSLLNGYGALGNSPGYPPID
jgi:hypothetical protein